MNGKWRCSYWDGIRIIYSQYSGIIVQKCPVTLHFNDEIIKQWSVEEFYNNENCVEEALNLVHTWPAKHHKEGRNGFCTQFGECWCPGEECQLKFVEVSLIPICNLHCRFCGAKQLVGNKVNPKTVQMLREINHKLLNSLKGRGLDYVRLTDVGEPLIFLQEVKDYLRNLTKDDMKFFKFTTNGTLFDNELLELIKEKEKEGVIVVPSISLNAYDAASYKAKMGADYFEKVYNLIYKLKENNIDFRVSFLIDDVSDIEKYEPIVTEFYKNNIFVSIFPDNNKNEEIIKSKKFIELRNIGVEQERTLPKIHPQVTGF